MLQLKRNFSVSGMAKNAPSFEFSKKTQKKLTALMKCYPDKNESALLPALHLVQK